MEEKPQARNSREHWLQQSAEGKGAFLPPLKSKIAVNRAIGFLHHMLQASSFRSRFCVCFLRGLVADMLVTRALEKFPCAIIHFFLSQSHQFRAQFLADDPSVFSVQFWCSHFCSCLCCAWLDSQPACPRKQNEHTAQVAGLWTAGLGLAILKPGHARNAHGFVSQQLQKSKRVWHACWQGGTWP